MRAQLNRIATAIGNAADIRDVCAFGGLVLVARGLHDVYPPAAWVVCGAALFWLGVKR